MARRRRNRSKTRQLELRLGMRVVQDRADASARPVADARTWLLRGGFVRGGGRASVDAVARGALP